MRISRTPQAHEAVPSPTKILIILQTLITSSGPPPPPHPPSLLSSFPPQAPPASPSRSYTTVLVDQPIDHFGYSPRPPTFKQRLLINDTHWTGDGPILFYTGNEGDIESFAANTGLMWDLAPDLKALLVFAEHRYYGASHPFPMPDALRDPAQMQFLTTQQALADFDHAVTYVRQQYQGAEDAAVVALGGSYGGMLAAYFRLSYPWQVAGAVASSAPILFFSGEASWHAFYEIITQDFQRVAPTVAQAWTDAEGLMQTPAGREELQDQWGLCETPSDASQWPALRAWAASVFVTLAMADYPSPANFLAPLPGWPVQVAMDEMEKADSPVAALRRALDVALGGGGDGGTGGGDGRRGRRGRGRRVDVGVGEEEHGDLNQEALLLDSSSTSAPSSCHDWRASTTPSLAADAWDYQVCTEYEEALYTTGPDGGSRDASSEKQPVVVVVGGGGGGGEVVAPLPVQESDHGRSDGIETDMFWAEPYDAEAFASYCAHTYGVVPYSHWAKTRMGGGALEGVTNILFPNGSLDPWAGGGITADINPQVKAVWIEDGAHHLDLRSPSVEDPSSVVEARIVEATEIEKWAKDWHENRGGRHVPRRSRWGSFSLGVLVGMGTGAVATSLIASYLAYRRIEAWEGAYARLPDATVL